MSVVHQSLRLIYVGKGLFGARLQSLAGSKLGQIVVAAADEGEPAVDNAIHFGQSDTSIWPENSLQKFYLRCEKNRISYENSVFWPDFRVSYTKTGFLSTFQIFANRFLQKATIRRIPRENHYQQFS